MVGWEPTGYRVRIGGGGEGGQVNGRARQGPNTIAKHDALRCGSVCGRFSVPGRPGRATEGEGEWPGPGGEGFHGTGLQRARTAGGYCGNTEGARLGRWAWRQGMGDKCLEGRTDGIEA